MQVFKCFFRIVRRQLPMLIMYTVIFISIAAGVARAGQSQEADIYADTQAQLTLIDRDDTPASRALCAHLSARHRAVPLPDDTQALQDALFDRQSTYILFIPQGYGDALAGEGDTGLQAATLPGSYTESLVDGQLSVYQATVRAWLAAGLPMEDALARTAESLGRETAVSMAETATIAMPGVYYFFLYLSYGAMMLMCFGLCPVLVVFGQPDVARRIEVSSLPLGRKNAGLSLGAAALALGSLTVFLVAGLALHGGAMLTASAALAALNALAFMLVALALAFLIGQVSRNTNMTSAMANTAVLAMCFLGGIYVPMEFLGAGMAKAARFIPTYWYAQGARAAFEAGAPGAAQWQTALRAMGVQLAFALCLMSVALVITKVRQRPGTATRQA